MRERNIGKSANFPLQTLMPILHILWDDSHIWGLLAARAARAMELPHRLVRGDDIARGLFSRERPSLLLVPGGNARHKAESLGEAGLAAIRDYVRSGGQYLGFCGGAGLALTWGDSPSGLGLCPWRRASFDDRLQHFMSGHLHVALAPRPLPSLPPDAAEQPLGDAARQAPPDAPAPMPPSDAATRTPWNAPTRTPPDEGHGPADGPALLPGNMPESPRLPVWWPGRFAPESGNGISVLASYERPGDDFWLADLAIADLPADTFAAWRDLYGLSLTPAFLAGQPCVIHGRYGKGNYILSYSHLETPASPDANRWLAYLLRTLGGLRPARESVPPWRPRTVEPLWEDPDMDRLCGLFDEVLQTGLRHGQIFCRTDWLMGWRTGIPGANLNNIWAALGLIRSLAPTGEAVRFWREQKESLLASADVFRKGAVQYLLAERLAMTLAKPLPSAVPAAMLRDQRESLFGPPMRAGGLYQQIIGPLDRLAYLQLS